MSEIASMSNSLELKRVCVEADTFKEGRPDPKLHARSATVIGKGTVASGNADTVLQSCILRAERPSPGWAL